MVLIVKEYLQDDFLYWPLCLELYLGQEIIEVSNQTGISRKTKQKQNTFTLLERFSISVDPSKIRTT